MDVQRQYLPCGMAIRMFATPWTTRGPSGILLRRQNKFRVNID